MFDRHRDVPSVLCPAENGCSAGRTEARRIEVVTMNTELQLQIQAYLDNELPASEARRIASVISNDLEAQELYRELKDTREIVSTNELPLRLQEPRDFYFSQIQRRIAAAEAAAPKE